MHFLHLAVFVLAVHMSPVLVSTTPVDGQIMYEPYEIYDYKMPESCIKEGKSFCFEKGKDYPEEKIKELLKDMRQLKVETPEPRSDIDSRSGDTYDEPDCPFESSDKPIYYIYDTRDKVRVVVQSPHKFEQIYSVKWCTNEGRITRDTPHFLKSTTLKNFNIECVSTTLNTEFLVLSEGPDLKMEIAKVKGGIPVCCKCRYNADL